MRRAPTVLQPPSTPNQPKRSSSTLAYLDRHARTSTTFPWTSDLPSPPPAYEHIYPTAPPPVEPQSFSRRPDAIPTYGNYPRMSRRAHANLSIPHLREALHSLDSKMATLLNERDMIESHLEQAVRLQSPVQRLPNELLSFIFAIGVLGLQEDDSLMLSTLMLVCRYWRDVAIDTPVLWSRIVMGTHHSLDRARMKLERSKSAPLHLHVDFSPRMETGSVTTEQVVRTMDLIRPSIWRWKTFDLTVPNRPQAHAALMRCREDALMLEVLSVRIFHSMQEDHYANPPLPLFNGTTPELRVCSFTSFNFSWDLGLVSHLRILKLGGYWNGYSPSIDNILGILRGCPQLEELVMRNISDVDLVSCGTLDIEPSEHDFADRLVRVSDPRVIHLPRLTSASFYYSGNVRTRTVLSLLSTPALEKIELCFLDNVSPVVEYLHRQSLTSLPLRHIRIESSFFNELKLARLLRRLPSLITLELVDVEDLSSNFMKDLSTPPVSQTWVCPKLVNLSIEGCTSLDWDALRSFVESRLPAHSRAFTRQISTSVACSAAAHSRCLPTSTSSASAFAANAHILAPPSTIMSNSAMTVLGNPQRLHTIDLTRCHQISKEMLQWLRMYVEEVKCETAKSVWGEPTLT